MADETSYDYERLEVAADRAANELACALAALGCVTDELAKLPDGNYVLTADALATLHGIHEVAREARDTLETALLGI